MEFKDETHRKHFVRALSGAALIGAMIVATTALADPPQGGYGPGYGMGPGHDGQLRPGLRLRHGSWHDGRLRPRLRHGSRHDGRLRPRLRYGLWHNGRLRYEIWISILSAEQRSKIAKIQDDVRRKA